MSNHTSLSRSAFRTLFPPKFREHGSESLILHFSYHKCLTVFYNKVLRDLSRETAFRFEHFLPRDIHFFELATKGDVPGVYSIHARHLYDLWAFKPFLGTHFIRHPKDLIVSGYKYHLWTTEPWCIEPMHNWCKYLADPDFHELILAHGIAAPKRSSYQEFLKSLPEELGMVLEMIWRKPTFRVMHHWDYSDERVLNIRYEDMIGNEEEVFRTIFTHYRFREDVIERGVQLAEEHSLKNQKKGKTKHTRSGASDQWVDMFSEDHHKTLNGCFLV